MTGPLVTVCIPVYNHEKYVAGTIKSVIAQDYKNIELIIINDGSTDASTRVVESFIDDCKNRFIRFLYIDRTNKGLCNTINEALEWAQGKYFSVLASDDQWFSHKAKLQVGYLEKTQNAAGVFGGIEFIDENGSYIRSKTNRFNRYRFEQIFLSKAFLPAPTQMLRTENLRRLGGFDPKIGIEDWYMWLRLTEHDDWSLDVLHQIVARYRRHDHNMSKQFEFMQREQEKILHIYRFHELYKKATQFLAIVQFNSIVLYDKNKAISLLPKFIGLWYHFRFLKAIVRLILPLSKLKRKFT
jgi:alpha-1,3-rhamnosyltransferase